MRRLCQPLLAPFFINLTSHKWLSFHFLPSLILNVHLSLPVSGQTIRKAYFMLLFNTFSSLQSYLLFLIITILSNFHSSIPLPADTSLTTHIIHFKLFECGNHSTQVQHRIRDHAPRIYAWAEGVDEAERRKEAQQPLLMHTRGYLLDRQSPDTR